MKLNVKLLSLAAAVAALVTSCVNEGLQEPLDAEILDAVPTLEEQAAAVEASVNDLQNLQTSLKEYDVELDAEIVALLEQHVADFKKGGVSLEEGILAAFELQKKLGATIGSLVAEMDSDIYTIKLKKNFTELETGVKAWVGENFESLYPVTVAEAMVKASVAKFDSQLSKQKLYVDALVSDVEAGLRKDEKPEELKALALSVQETSCDSKKLSEDLAALTAEVEKEYKAAVRTMLSDPAQFDSEALKEFNANAGIQLASVDNSLSSLITRVELCESQLNGILARLGALEGLVEDLEELLGMIQSVTLMTEYSADEAVAYYNMGSSTTSEGYKVRQPSGNIDLRYVVRPAAAASSLTASSLWNNGLKVIGYYAGRIQQAAVGNMVNFTIKNVTADNLSGVVTVTVENKLSDDFYYKKTGAKMALSVTTGKTDITSKFVEVVPKDASGTVYLESLTLSKDEVEFDNGDELNLGAIISPSNVTNKALVWTSENKDVVTVNESGRITGTGVGSAIVTVTSRGTDEWGRTLSATCKVKVNPAIKLGGPSYVEEGKNAELTLDFPSSMAIESKVWMTSDETKATVSNDGVVSGVAHTYNQYTFDYAPVTVTCIVNGEITLTHEMKVVVPQPKSIKLNHYDDNVSELTMKLDQSLDLGATINPVPASGQFRLMYQSTSASGLGWVDSSTGKINEYKKTLSQETVYVYIDVLNIDKHHYFAPGRSLRRTVIVRVEPYYVQTITMDDLDLEPGAKVVLNPKFTSDVSGVQPTNTAVDYISSNPSVATVDADGTLSAISSGEVIITARSKQDPSKVGTCTVRVTAPWKAFEVGQYILNNNGEIEFASTVTSSNKSKIIGVVIAKTNPRVSDAQLPEDCTHGIAVALGQATSLKWWSDTPSSEPYNMYKYTISSYNTKGYGDPRGVQYNAGSYSATEEGNKPGGYSNTELLRDMLSLHGLSSAVIQSVDAYGVQRPNGTSKWYLPSVYEMVQIYQCYKNNGLDKLLNDAGGSALSNWDYWTVSEVVNNENSYVGVVNPMTGTLKTKQKTSTSSLPYLRYVIAF